MRKSTKIVLGAALIIFPIYIFIQFFVPAYNSATPIEVEIPQGTSYSRAVDILVENKLIRDKFLFLTLGRLTGLDTRLRAGYYHFWSSISPFDVFLQLKNGKIVEYDITVVEGDGLLEIGEKLEAKNFISAESFRDVAMDVLLLNSLDITGPSVEGYLYPETYKLQKGARPDDIIKLMVGKLRDSYTDEIKEGMKRLKWNENQVLTLASIIEKEAATDQERPLVSAVYHNRLRKHMPLQADPTAIYGVKSSKIKIKSSDLRNRTLYNTYVIKGLPPGPIASPGIKSIKAAVFPAKVPYLFFVARGDRTHIFTTTMTEHSDAIRKVRASGGGENREE
jgi:UPF0755 protein